MIGRQSRRACCIISRHHTQGNTFPKGLPMLRALVVSGLMLFTATGMRAQQEHTLLAKPDTVAWGYYSGMAKPALTVKSGDTVRMQTLSTCGPRERLLK